MRARVTGRDKVSDKARVSDRDRVRDGVPSSHEIVLQYPRIIFDSKPANNMRRTCTGVLMQVILNFMHYSCHIIICKFYILVSSRKTLKVREL